MEIQSLPTAPLKVAETIESLVHTGGMYIELSFCSWSNYKKGGKRLQILCEKAVNTKESTLTIYGCDFNENNERHGDIVRGGGLSVFISGGSSRNEVRVESCNFSNNAAALGGGWTKMYWEITSKSSIQPLF